MLYQPSYLSSPVPGPTLRSLSIWTLFLWRERYGGLASFYTGSNLILLQRGISSLGIICWKACLLSSIHPWNFCKGLGGCSCGVASQPSVILHGFVFVPTPFCFHSCGSVVYVEIMNADSPSLIFFCSGFLQIPWYFCVSTLILRELKGRVIYIYKTKDVWKSHGKT